MDNAVDDAVLNVITETFAQEGPGAMIRSALIEENAAKLGLSSEAVGESIHVLHRSGKVKGRKSLGGGWTLSGPSAGVWLGYAASRGFDLNALRVRVLTDVINTGKSTLELTHYGELPQVFMAVLEEFRGQGLFDSQTMRSGVVHISHVSPLAKRALDQMSRAVAPATRAALLEQ